MDNSIRIPELMKYARENYPKLPYHNFSHAMDVYFATKDYSRYYFLCDNDRLILESSAILHDIVYVPFQEGNEEKSAERSAKILKTLEYSISERNKINNLIIATKWPTNPTNLLEEIICDCDLDNLSREDFFEKSELLMKEWGIQKDYSWYYKQLEFLENNHYYTHYAQLYKQPGKEKNILFLKNILTNNLQHI